VTTLIDMEKHKDILSVMQATVASLNRDNEELKMRAVCYGRRFHHHPCHSL
jgi:hypothetical protein